MITTDDIDQLGADGIVEAIKKRVGNKPVYLRSVVVCLLGGTSLTVYLS